MLVRAFHSWLYCMMLRSELNADVPSAVLKRARAAGTGYKQHVWKKGVSSQKHWLMQGKSSCTAEGNAASGRGIACKAHNCWLPEALLLLGGFVRPRACIEP